MWSHRSRKLCAPGVSFVWVMCALLLELSLDCYWPVHAWDWPSGWLTVRLNPYHSIWAAVHILTTQSRICLNSVWSLQRSPFGYAACEVNWILLWCCLKLANVCIGSGPVRQTLLQANVRCCLWVTLGNLFWSYKWSTVCGCLSWVCTWRTKLHTKAGFYQVWSWE